MAPVYPRWPPFLSRAGGGQPRRAAPRAGSITPGPGPEARGAAAGAAGGGRRTPAAGRGAGTPRFLVPSLREGRPPPPGRPFFFVVVCTSGAGLRGRAAFVRVAALQQVSRRGCREARRAVCYGAWLRSLSSREGAPRGGAWRCWPRGTRSPGAVGARGRSRPGCGTPGRAACLQAAGRPERTAKGLFRRERERSAAPRHGRLDPLMLRAPMVTRDRAALVADSDP